MQSRCWLWQAAHRATPALVAADGGRRNKEQTVLSNLNVEPQEVKFKFQNEGRWKNTKHKEIILLSG